jgi:opacity protein-like surface antigen
MFKNMKTRTLLHAVVIFVISILLIGTINAQTRNKSRAPEFQRFSLSLGGGMSSLEEHRHLLNLGAEIQVALASRVRLGLGIGYLNNMHGRRGGMDDRYSNERNDWSSGWMTLLGNGKNPYEGSGSDTTIRVIPVTLNVYYFVPIGRKWNVYAAAGASYNFGSFREGTLSQHKGAFGGQAGLGVEFRLADRLRLIGEGSYRFVEFHELRHPESATNLWAELLGLGTDSWSRTGWGKLISEFLDQTFGRNGRTEETHYNLNLNGFNCRLGVKFGF